MLTRFFLIISLFPFLVVAQVQIKERIELNKHTSIAYHDSSDVYQGMSFDKSNNFTLNSTNVDTTTFLTLPYKSYVQVEILGGFAAGSHILYLRSHGDIVIVDNPLGNIGYLWESSVFPSGTELDFGLWFNGNPSIPPQWEFGAIRSPTSSTSYKFSFNDADYDRDYDDVIIEVEIFRVCEDYEPFYIESNLPQEYTITATSHFGVSLWLSNCLGELHYLNSNETFSAEIVQGFEYAELYNPVTMEFGTMLSEIAPVDNIAEFGFSSSVLELEEEVNIKIKISSVVPNTADYYFNLKMIPSLLKVYFEPETIMPGDTATLNFLVMDEGGVEVSPPEDMVFLVSVVDYPPNGRLFDPITEQDDFNLFGVKGGIKFIANEFIEEDTIECIIFAEEDSGPGGIGKIIQSNDNPSNIHATDANQPPEFFYLPLSGIGKIKIIKEINNCEEFACTNMNEPKPPTFEVNTMTPTEYSIQYGKDWCKVNPPSGLFKPLFERSHTTQTIPFVKDFEIEPCFNTSTNSWQPEVSGGSIKLNSVLGVCTDNLEGEDKILIDDFNDLVNLASDGADLCEILEDFEMHYNYDNFERSELKYVILPVIQKHEEIHKERFENLIKNDLMNSEVKINDNIPKQSFSDLFTYYQYACEGNFHDFNYVKNKFHEHFNDVINKLIPQIKIHYDEQTADPTNEYETHKDKRIRKIINDFIDQLEDLPNYNCIDAE